MDDLNLNNLPEFDKPDSRTGIIRWMWWLYAVVGLFVICLLIWMFVALSKNRIDVAYEEPWTDVPAQTVQTDSVQGVGEIQP